MPCRRRRATSHVSGLSERASGGPSEAHAGSEPFALRELVRELKADLSAYESLSGSERTAAEGPERQIAIIGYWLLGLLGYEFR